MPLSMSLLGFGMGTMLANFHMCAIMLVLRAVFNMLARNASPRGSMCLRCLIFSLSVVDSVMLYPCILCVSLLMDMFVLCVACFSVCEFLGETIRNMFGCGCYFVVECY